MRILIWGAGFVNKGAEAMLKTVKTELAMRIDQVQFVVLDSPIYHEEILRETEIEVIKLRYPKGFRLIIEIIKFLLLILIYPHKKILVQNYRYFLTLDQLMSEIDAVIDISGFAYGNSWGTRNIYLASVMSELARKKSVSHIFLPQAWGPFDKNDTVIKENVLKLRQNSKLLVARDRQSRAYLSHVLDEPVETIDLCCDIAFRFQKGDKDRGWQLLSIQNRSIKQGDSFICIAPNMRVYERSQGFGINNEYIQLLLLVAKQFAEKNIAIAFIPHEINSNRASMDDRILCELIRMQLNYQSAFSLTDDNMTAEDIKSVISCSQMLVGSRFHSLVATLHSCVPAVAIGWSHKYQELFNDLGLNSYVIDHNKVHAEAVIEIVEQAWNNRVDLRANLLVKIPSFERQVDALFDQTQRLILNQ